MKQNRFILVRCGYSNRVGANYGKFSTVRIHDTSQLVPAIINGHSTRIYKPVSRAMPYLDAAALRNRLETQSRTNTMLRIELKKYVPGEDLAVRDLSTGMCDIVLHEGKEHLVFMTHRGLVSLTDSSVFWDMDQTVRYIRPVEIKVVEVGFETE